MMSEIPYFSCILLFCCIRNGWSEHVQVEMKSHAGKIKQTGYSGDSLIIGLGTKDKWKTLFDIELIPNDCTILKIADYKQEYETRVLKGPSRSSKVGQRAKEISYKVVNPSEYFIHVKKEVWSCQPPTQKERDLMKEKSLKYLRIVNEMISIREIYDISYDAVDVSVVKYYRNKIRVKVEETKCLALRGKKKVVQVQCEAVSTFNRPDSSDLVVPNLVQKYVVSQKQDHRESSEYKKDVFVNVGDANIKEISNKGKSLKIGSILTKKKTVRLDSLDNEEKYACRLKRGVSPLLFTPEVYQKFDIGDSKSSYAKITHEYFSELFTVVDRQVHVCRLHMSTRRVYRVLNTMIGKTEIYHVMHEPGILELYSISLRRGGNSIRFTTVDYFYADTRERVAYDDVYYNIKSLPDHYSTWKNSTMKNPLLDIVYKLCEGAVFRTLINPEGFNLRVGSRIVKTIGQTDSTVQCTKNAKNQYLNQFNTVLKLNVVEDDAFHAEVMEEDRIFIEYTSKESWLCESNEVNVKFYRIVNKLRLPADLPVHEIESFDGVEILIEALNGDRKSVDILEVKYMDSQNKVVFYEGLMEFQMEEIFTSFEASQLPNAVSKNEIFPLIDDMPLRKQNTKDHFDGIGNCQFNTNAKGNAVMDFIVKPPKKIKTSRQSLYICKSEETHFKSLLPYFKIDPFPPPKDKSQKIDEMQNAEDESTNSKYFENIDNKVWTCKSEGSWFHRVVNEQSLREQIQIFTRPTITSICHTDMDKVWFEMARDNEFVVKMEGVRHTTRESSAVSKKRHYPNLKDDYLINYGHFMLFEEKPRKGAWKSGTKKLKLETNSKTMKSKLVQNVIEMKETDYDLHAGRVNKVPFSRNRKVNEDNPSLRIGSKWSIHEPASLLHCKADATFTPEHSAEVHFQTKVVSITGGVASAEDVFQDYFTSFSLRTWKCTDQVTNREILRVMNRFKFIEDKLDQVKDIFYYDGVKVVSKKVEYKQTLEIIEVKYLNSTTKEMVRFDGLLKISSAGEKTQSNGMILPASEEIIAFVEVNYNLNENEKYRSDMSLKGVVLEIGQRYKSNYDEQINNNAKFMRMKCDKVIGSDETNDLLQFPAFNPKVMIFEESEKYQVHPVKMNDKTFKKYFKREGPSTEVWLCSDVDYEISKPFYRVVHQLSMKDKQEYSISHVYHYDGVTIHDNQLIEEIKYVSKNDGGEYCVIRFDGFVVRNWEIGIGRFFCRKGRSGIKEIDYFPFRKVLFTANMHENDVTYEVKSHWNVEMRNDDNDIITCIKKNNPSMNEFCKTEICGSSLSAKILIGTDKWDEIRTEEHFTVQGQDVWHCKRNGKLVFKRYVNKLYKTDSTTARVYYPAGVSVEVIKLPDDKTFLQIIQVKLLKADTTSTLVKYVGKLRLVSEVLPGAENFLINYSYSKESRGLEPSNAPYWPLDILRVFAISYISSYTKTKLLPKNKYAIEAVKYNKDRDALQTKMVNDKAERVFKIGTPWEDEIKQSNTGKFRCILDTWNSKDIFKYTPRVVEYVDDSLYQLNDVAFHQVFEMKKIDVYICRNQWDEFLRLESVFQGRIPILAVRYSDGVDVKIIEDNRENQVEITETLYMDVMASAVLKFVESPRTIGPSSPLSRIAEAGKKLISIITTGKFSPKCG